MQPALLFLSFFAALALATPVNQEKRYMVTEVVWETEIVTVTAKKGWGSWGRPGRPTQAPSSPSSAAVTTQTTTQEASTPSPVPPSSSVAPPSASSAPTSSAAPSTPPTPSSVSAYADPILFQHNLHRKNHSATDITWDDGLADIARQIAESCHYAHDTKTGGGGYGQNIGAGSPGEQVPSMITNLMYNNEMMDYPGYGSEPDMSNFERWGHFSQIVWKGTQTVGCFTQYCPGGLTGVGSNVSPYFTVCNYKPVGNMQGAFTQNVLKPLGQAMVVVPHA